ncbi:hypothetical protein TNCV_3591371 [Trichonephila clavipes]|nr:hypothetical protein TNCV_3591371 [Trichonephila clavipes]
MRIGISCMAVSIKTSGSTDNEPGPLFEEGMPTSYHLPEHRFTVERDWVFSDIEVYCWARKHGTHTELKGKVFRRFAKVQRQLLDRNSPKFICSDHTFCHNFEQFLKKLLLVAFMTSSYDALFVL